MTEIVEIGGDGCANCYALFPVLKKLAEEKGFALRTLALSPQTEQEIRNYRIERVPTVLVLRDGKELGRCTGYQPEEILSAWLDAVTNA